MAFNDGVYRISSVERQVFLGNLVTEEISLKNNVPIRKLNIGNTEKISLKNNDPIRKLNIGNTEEEVIRLDK